MIALRLVRLIEDHSDKLAQGLLEKFRESPRTQDFSNVPAQELRDRVHEILYHLSEWLLQKKDSDIEKRYREIGARRSAQNVSLSDYCWAIVLTKEHIWEFLQRQGFLQSPMEIYGELELLRLLDQFFDRAMYYVTEGYEQAEALSRVGVSQQSAAAQVNV
ncbi:MAG TPA: hypothetical protein VMT53_03875 [Terriglobales bacterium]|nr:hypothetical protein [Terriglobales bacterium]